MEVIKIADKDNVTFGKTGVVRTLEFMPLRSGRSYATACNKALELGLAPESILETDAITRGDMAILLDRALDYMA